MLLKEHRVLVRGSGLLFFVFIGHLLSILKEILLGRLTLSRHHVMLTIYQSGARLVLPLVLISGLLAAAIMINVYHMLSPFYLQDHVLLVTQEILFYSVLPWMLSLVLSTHLSLNLVRARIKGLQRTTEDVTLSDILPFMLGACMNALLLYLYCLNAIMLSLYLCLVHFLKTDMHQYFFHLSHVLTNINLSYSIFKTLFYCAVVSIVVGYYYYVVAERQLLLRVAMSRIMTRSVFWLTAISVYFKSQGY